MDTFQAPPMPSGGEVGNAYKQRLRHQFVSIVQHAIEMFGPQFVRETTMKALADAAPSRDRP